MAKKAGKRRAARKPATAKLKARKPAGNRKEEGAFEESLVRHGQAAPRRPDGTLPPGATHEIMAGENGEKKIVRRRFSIL